MVWINIVFTMLCTVLISRSVFSARTGKFKIADNGVKGEGTYSLENSTAEINLHLLIGKPVNVPMFMPGSPGPTEMQPKQKNRTVDEPNSHVNSDVTEKEKTSTYQNTATGSKLENPSNSSSPEQNKEPISMKILTSEAMLSADDIHLAIDGLKDHNKFRKMHNAPTLKLDRQMCAQAQAFARQLAKLGTLKHSARDTRPNQGENLAMGCSSGDATMTAGAAAKKWYDEVCQYDFKNKTFQKQCGHFSQIVWKSSDSLGIGQAKGNKWGMNCTFIVARYAPLGNIANTTDDNVEKGTFDQSYCNTVTRAKVGKNIDRTADNGETEQLDMKEGYPGYYPDYGLNEGFLNDEGESSRSVGFREKIPRIGLRIEVI